MIIQKIIKDLAYRGATDDQPLAFIVLSRREAEQLIAEWKLAARPQFQTEKTDAQDRSRPLWP